MTRERIAGIMLGISVGTAIGFFLKPVENLRRNTRSAGARNEINGVLQRRDPPIVTSLRPDGSSLGAGSRLAGDGRH